MTNRPGLDALAAALSHWRRNALAAGSVVGGFAVASAVGTRVALYGAGLAAFVVWMVWFVLTAVDWLERADF